MLGILMGAMGVVGLAFMPDSWHQRMQTIETYEQDASAMGRINAWQYAINVASDRLTGGGLESWEVKSFAIYAPDPLAVHAAHSIYFSVLADHGWFGLFLFLAILKFVWGNLSWVVKNAPESNGAKLSKMIKVSLIAYMSGGAFLSLSYFDLPWQLVALSVLLRAGVERKQNVDCAPIARNLDGRRLN